MGHADQGLLPTNPSSRHPSALLDGCDIYKKKKLNYRAWSFSPIQILHLAFSACNKLIILHILPLQNTPVLSPTPWFKPDYWFWINELKEWVNRPVNLYIKQSVYICGELLLNRLLKWLLNCYGTLSCLQYKQVKVHTKPLCIYQFA